MGPKMPHASGQLNTSVATRESQWAANKDPEQLNFLKMTMNNKEVPKDPHPKWFHEEKIQYLVSATSKSYRCWLSTVPKLEAFSHTSPLLLSVFSPWRVQNQKEQGMETVAQRKI